MWERSGERVPGGPSLLYLDLEVFADGVAVGTADRGGRAEHPADVGVGKAAVRVESSADLLEAVPVGIT